MENKYKYLSHISGINIPSVALPGQWPWTNTNGKQLQILIKISGVNFLPAALSGQRPWTNYRDLNALPT